MVVKSPSQPSSMVQTFAPSVAQRTLGASVVMRKLVVLLNRLLKNPQFKLA